MTRLAAAAIALPACLALAACSAPVAGPAGTAEPPLVARFFLEVAPGEAGVPAVLPRSGVTVVVSPRPVVVEYDIANAEVVQVDLGLCLLVELNAAAARDLHRLSVASVGRRLVLSLDDRFVGARPIDGAMAEGTLLTFVELPDAELPALVARLKKTSAELAAAAKKAGRS